MKPPSSICEVLQIWRDQDPQAPALRGTQGPWLSRADLGHRVEEGRRVLRQAGLSASERVAVFMPQCLDGAVVALQVAGACSLAPLRAGTPAERWPAVLEALAPAAVVLARGAEPALAAAAEVLGIPVLDPELLFNPAAEGQPEVEGEGESAGESIVIATSGTTGVPKWVCHGQSSLLGGCGAMARSLALSPEDRTLLALPLHHVHGLVSALMMPLASGGSVVVAEGFDPAALLACLAEQGISWISLPPAMHRALLDQHGRTPLAAGHRLRFLRSGAISLPGRLIDELRSAFGVPVIEAYGMSECPHICGNPIDAPRLGSVGKPVVEELAVVDGAGEPLPVGAWGQVVVRGRPVMAGYLGAEQGSAAAFRDGWLQTGDEGRLDPAGYLELRGRLSERINRGGLKVIPAVVDAALLRHPSVREAMAFALPHPTLGDDLAAAVVPHPGAGLDEQELRRHVFQLLASHEVPSRIVVVEAFPRGPTGKVQRCTLGEAFAAHLIPPHDEPSGELEHRIAATFSAVLRQEQPGRHANFFQLGGDSLSGMRVIQALEQQLGLSLPPSLLFACPSPRSLAERLAPMRNARSGQEGENQELCADPGELKRIPTAQPLAGAWPAGCEAFPASHAQARLWFLHQLEPGLTAYHLPALWRLTGALDVAALEQALGALIERHPTLRTSFRLQGSEVVQIIHPPTPFHHGSEPLADRNPDAVIEQWLEQERTTPFDLASGQLLRARLLAVDHQHHLLLLNHHHIASDGWSRSVLVGDLTALYNASRSGQASELAPLQVQYHDYAAWQRQRLSGDRLQSLKDYWIPQLTALEPLELPSDHPRPATPSHRGASVAFQITPELLAPFEQLCRLEGATLQMGLLALLALLLHRYSRQEDFAIGVPIWGRNHPDLEPLIGFFINTLPVRTRFTPEQSFRELLQQVKASSLGAYDLQELPFEQMVEALNLPRDTSRNPLVQVMLQLIELPDASLQGLAEVESEVLVGRPSAAKLDLEFYLRRTEQGGLRSEVVYATELFGGDRIERMSSHLLTLLASALNEPDASAASLCLLPDCERQLIESWQHGPTIDVPDLCVHQLFEQQAERTPDDIALIFEDQQLTYLELSARANQLAHYLINLGVGPEVIVGVCLERSVELIVSLLAILKAGGAYLPIDPSWPAERQQFLLKEATCNLLINQSGTTVLDASSPQCRPASGSPLAYVTYTSGSTGKPKGVAISHHSILRLVDPVNGFLLSAGHRVLQLAPVAFDAATLEIWGPLLNGGTLVVAPPEQPSLPALAALLKKHNITTVWLTAGLFHAMVEAELSALAGIQQVLAGGDVLSAEHVQRLLAAFPSGHELINGYGPTENTTFTCCQHIEAAATVDTNGVAIGRPIANTEVRVLDESGQLCPIGIPGELHIGGAGLARGYLNNPELTAEKFIPDPFSSDPTARLYKSGDLASWNPDGTLAFHGRIDQQIKLRGFRIEPGEIEANLLAHPAVAQAVVLLRNDDPNNPRLIAYWVADASQPPTTSASSEQLRIFLSERLPDYMVPAAFLQLEALPLTPNGKLDRKALPAPFFSGNLEQRVAPSTDLERQLHVIWAEVLGHSDFGITDNFFAVGGHSLAAANLVSRAEKATGISISLAKLFQNPTISGLVDQLGKEKGEPQQDDLCCLIPLQPLGSRPPLVIVSGFGGCLFFEEGARFLAPHQPVYGLRVIGDLASMGCQSFETIISTFADLIVDFWRQGDVNLMGYSAGGWYAHALAAELLRRGRRIGALVIIDTVPNIRINRSLGARLLLDRLSQVRLRMHMRNLVSEPTLEKRKTFIWDKMRTLKQAIEAYIGLRIPRPGVSLAKAMPAKTRPQTDFFVDLVRNSYRAAPLPITIAFLATPLTAQRYKRLWRHCTTRDLQTVVFYGEHLDVLRPDFQPKLALLIDNFLIGQQDGSC